MQQSFKIRDAQPEDVSALILLMRGLARFEGYLDRFAVTAEDLLQRGFDPNREPQFNVIVAEVSRSVVGYALTYVVPFTFDLRPTLVLKEFFVAEEHRGAGMGHDLFRGVLDHGRKIGARLLRWQVLPSNEPAARFYRSFGGAVDADWDNWVLELR
jgi:GNAT superfamily N-acetyltransferase